MSLLFCIVVHLFIRGMSNNATYVVPNGWVIKEYEFDRRGVKQPLPELMACPDLKD
jgi:serine protease inhibitor ecotin